jgi:hypothetical protein
MMFMTPCSAGDLLDRITILQIKSHRIEDPAKLRHVLRELESLEETAADLLNDPMLWSSTRELYGVNLKLWDIEEQVRLFIRASMLGEDYVAVATKVPQFNDRRATIKRRINELVGSALVEVKSHAGL